MTTIDTAAAWRPLKLVTFAVFIAFFGISLAGCGTTTNIFAPTSDTSSSSIVDPAANTKLALASNTQKILIAPVIGAPDVIAKHLQSELGLALAKNSISVAKTASEGAAYTLRGYVVSARKKSSTKISYIWDVTDASGKRVNRITGEESAPASTTNDPWAAMTPRIVQAISSKTASSLATWLPTQVRTAAVTGTGAGAAATQGARAVAGSTAAAGTSTAAALTGAAAASATTTGSINKTAAYGALVPSVTGAPGDGGVSLTNAIRNELSKGGVSMSPRAAGQTYKVIGRVKVGPGKGGTQPIQIDWDVRDPSGKKLGTVSQKNDIPAGSLNGAWGKTANAAAAAAAQGILKLLPKQTRTN